MKKTTPDPARLAGPTPTSPTAPGLTPGYLSPNAVSQTPVPSANPKSTGAAPALAPPHGDKSLSTDVTP